MRMSLHFLCSQICWSDFSLGVVKIMTWEHVDDKMFHKIPIYLYRWISWVFMTWCEEGDFLIYLCSCADAEKPSFTTPVILIMWWCGCTGLSEHGLLLSASSDEHVMPLYYTCTSQCTDPEALADGGHGVRTSPLKNHNNLGFIANSGPDPLET